MGTPKSDNCLDIGSSVMLRDQICAGPCAGLSAITPWQDPAGELALLVYQGDLGQCAHRMTIWYDPTGSKLLALSDKPVYPEQAAAHGEQIAALQTGLTEGAPIYCE